MNRKPLLISIGVVAILVIAAVGYVVWSGSGPAPSSEPITIAFNTWIGYSSFYIAEEKGFFAERGLTVETRVIDPLAEKNAALIRGDIQGMGGTIDSAVVSAASGVNGKVVFMFDRSNGTDGILVTDDVKELADLKGKKVALEEGFVGHFFLLYMLDKNGIDPSQVAITPMTTDAAGAAFVSGSVDAAVTWEPYLSTAKKREGAHVLVSSKEVEPILADTLFMSDTFVESHQKEVDALVAALQEANNYWIAHPKECNEIVARRWNMELAEVEDIMTTVELYSTEHQRKQFGPAGGKGELNGYMAKAAELWLKAGVIDKQVDTDKYIDGRSVQALAQ